MKQTVAMHNTIINYFIALFIKNRDTNYG